MAKLADLDAALAALRTSVESKLAILQSTIDDLRAQVAAGTDVQPQVDAVNVLKTEVDNFGTPIP